MRKEAMEMRRFTIPRTTHCNEEHGQVLDMTENCPFPFMRKGGVAIGEKGIIAVVGVQGQQKV